MRKGLGDKWRVVYLFRSIGSFDAASGESQRSSRERPWERRPEASGLDLERVPGPQEEGTR